MNIDLNILDILTLPNKILAPLTIASGLLLFSPTELAEKLYIIGFRENYGFIIGIVFIISFSLLITNLICMGGKFIKRKQNIKRFYDEAEDKLKGTNNYQKSIIYFLYSRENYTDLLPLHDGAVHMLVDNYMIGKATDRYMVADPNEAMFPYYLQPWVIQELDKNPTFAKHLKNAFDEYKRDELIKNLKSLDYSLDGYNQKVDPEVSCALESLGSKFNLEASDLLNDLVSRMEKERERLESFDDSEG